MANQSIHTLLVEDNPGDTRLIRELVTEGSAVHFTWENVASLSEAKDILRVEPFDLVLLDLSLPDSQGLNTFIHLHPHAICLPVVVLANLDDELLAIQALRAGAQDFVVKGQIEGESFVRAVRAAIERKHTETALRATNRQLTALTQQLWPKARFASSMDDLVAGLIRDLNNPLATISVQLEELLAQFTPNDPKHTTLEAIQAEVEQMGKRLAGPLQAAMDHAQEEETHAPDLIQFLRELKAGKLRNDETRFFEALGEWVANYIYKNTSVTPRSLNNFAEEIKPGGISSYEQLSPREREIVRLVAKGRTNKEIAKVLSISIRTVERHRTSLMNKLGLQNRAELVAYAVGQGILTRNDKK